MLRLIQWKPRKQINTSDFYLKILILNVEFTESSFSHLCDKQVCFKWSAACKTHWNDYGCFHNHTFQATHCALLRSRKCQRKKPHSGGELQFASYSWESLCNIHPPKFSLLSKEVLVKNTDAIVPPPTLLKQGFISMLSETITLQKPAAE